MDKARNDRKEPKKPAQALIFFGVAAASLLGLSLLGSEGAAPWSTPINAVLLAGSMMLMGSVAAFAGRMWRGVLAVAALSSLGGYGVFLTHDNVPAGLLGWLVGSFLVTRYTVRVFHWGFRFLAAVVYGAVVGGVANYLWANTDGFLRYPYAGGAALAGVVAAFLLVSQIQRPNREEAHYGTKAFWRFLNQAALMSLVVGGGVLSYSQPVLVNYSSDDLPEPQEIRQEIETKISKIDVNDAAELSARVRKLLDDLDAQE